MAFFFVTYKNTRYSLAGSSSVLSQKFSIPEFPEYKPTPLMNKQIFVFISGQSGIKIYGKKFPEANAKRVP